MLVKPNPADLLAWYDQNARLLPWRAAPGAPRQIPYWVWLSEIMLQQTTVSSVIPYFQTFISRWPTLEALAYAPLDEVLSAWAGLGYYARARNLHACAQHIIAHHGGQFPSTVEALRQLPGVGIYTAGAIAAIAFDARVAVVDGNVERIVSRLLRLETPLPKAKPIIYKVVEAMVPAARPGDFAQAMMDLGATICTPRQPKCTCCPWSSLCAACMKQDAEQFPRKAPKPQKPHRLGMAFWLSAGDDVLLVRRPSKGLLGGMLGFPTTAWVENAKPEIAHALSAWRDQAPLPAEWHQCAGSIRHVFTHFQLTLELAVARLEEKPLLTQSLANAVWVPKAQLKTVGLPTVFAKLIDLYCE